MLVSDCWSVDVNNIYETTTSRFHLCFFSSIYILALICVIGICMKSWENAKGAKNEEENLVVEEAFTFAPKNISTCIIMKK